MKGHDGSLRNSKFVLQRHRLPTPEEGNHLVTSPSKPKSDGRFNARILSIFSVENPALPDVKNERWTVSNLERQNNF